ncbi:hypothetical protein EDD16DRAFT_1759374 [Pisolithus croceorrhizus]|nr:hypothetical protein EDD16DRAFT_1759374 [Pisolithus croceorrhizus]
MSPCSLHTCTLLTLITSAPSGVFIPTQSRIQAAREKCEHLRVIHSEEDYISLAATTPTDTYQGPHRESRLTRQEDELGEGIDGTNTPSIRVRKKRSRHHHFPMTSLKSFRKHEIEETIEWGGEQLRRGGLNPFAAAGVATEKQTLPLFIARSFPPLANPPELSPAVGCLAHSLSALKASHTSNDEWKAWPRFWMKSILSSNDWGVNTSVLKERVGMIIPRRKQDDQDHLFVRITTGGGELLSDVVAAEFKDPSLELAKWFELVGWNPLDPLDILDDFSWYLALYEYSQLYDEDANAETLEPLQTLLDSRGFDPYSVRDVKRIIDVPEQVEVSICSHKILMILKSMHSVFENATAAAETLLSPFLRASKLVSMMLL